MARPSRIDWSPPPSASKRGSPSGTMAMSPFELMMSGYRVFRKHDENSTLRHGEPGPEGIHQDDAELTVIVLLRRDNVAEGSGGNRIWRLEQPCGKPSAEDLSSGLLLANPMLSEPFD